MALVLETWSVKAILNELQPVKLVRWFTVKAAEKQM